MAGRIQLGDLVRDRITGFEGVVIARTQWLNMCDRYTVQPRKLDDKGGVSEPHSFDDADLEVVEEAVIERTFYTPENGGPAPEPDRGR